MNGLARMIMILGLLGGVPAGCGGGLTPIPSGAQQVHISDTETSVQAEPATVHPGDVYVVLDGPRQNVVFVARKPTAEATPGPMSDEDIDRLVHGDTEGTSIEGISVGGSAQQRAAGRGQIGFGGNVYKFVLAAGKYAFLLDPPEGQPLGVVPASAIAILDVAP